MTLTYSHIVVAIDGSKSAKFAFRKAIDIAVRNQAILNLVTIVDKPAFGMIEAYDKDGTKRTYAAAQDLLEKYKKEAESIGVEKVNVIIEYGIAKEKIPREIAERTGADLIICGATGLTGTERIIMGSISQSIVRYAKCDVLVVRSKRTELDNFV